MWVAMGLFYQMIPKHAWVSRSHINLWNWPKSRLDRNWYICFGCYQRDWESWKGIETIILMVWWHFMKEYAILCVYYILTCHRHFMLHRAINYFIERFGYFLVCSVINAVIINAVKHQKVTKSFNKVIISWKYFEIFIWRDFWNV